MTIKTFKTCEIKSMLDKYPKAGIGFYPTPFHKLENISEDLGIELYIKREDLTGPSNFGGNKTRKIEYIVGEALKNNVDYLMTVGGYNSNAAMQLTQYCNICGIKPILFLGDTKAEKDPEEYKSNLLLDKILGAEIHLIHKDQPKKDTNLNPLWDKVDKALLVRKKELEDNGYKAMHVPVGCTSEVGWISYLEVFIELLEQTKEMAVELDYIFHTNGSGGSLPGLLVGKFLTGSNIEIKSINNRLWAPGERITEDSIVERVFYIFDLLNIEPPTEKEIRKQINYDCSYLGPGYAIPTEKGNDAIRYMARKEGLFLDPTYTGKGFSGLIDYAKKGVIAQGSKVAFIHSGGTGGLFAGAETLGGLLVK